MLRFLTPTFAYIVVMVLEICPPEHLCRYVLLFSYLTSITPILGKCDKSIIFAVLIAGYAAVIVGLNPC